jgi:hypothetical protein
MFDSKSNLLAMKPFGPIIVTADAAAAAAHSQWGYLGSGTAGEFIQSLLKTTQS